MKKLILKALILIIFVSMSQNSLSQVLNWENYNTLNTNLYSYRNGTFGTDAAYDNYGLHLAVICQGQIPCNNTLNYYHFDNSGKKLDSIRSIESNVLGVCIGSNNGKVYIAAFKNGDLKIYQRINGVSDLQFKLSYDPPNYGTTSTDQYFVNMSMAFIGEKMYLVWDRVNYITSTFGYDGAVGFAMYDPSENVMTSYLPLNHFDFGEFGRPLIFPKMISSNNKLHIVCTYPRPGLLIDTMFVTKDIYFDGLGNPIYEPLKGVLNWGIQSPGVNYIQSQQTRANIISTGSELYIIASLSYLEGSEIRFDMKLKHKNINGDWNSDFLDVIYDSKSFFKAPSISYNPISSKVGFAYSAYVDPGIYKGKFIEYDIIAGNLLLPQEIMVPQSQNLVGGWIGKSLHGEYVVMNSWNLEASFFGARRPAEISGNITYNTLLTGNEIFNAPMAPYCRTDGADIEALANSTTRLKANTRVFIDEGDLIIFRANSCLVYEPNSEIFPSDRLIYETNCITWENLACNRTYPGGSIKFSNELNYTVDNGGFIVIDANSTLEISDNTNLIFDGSNSYLKLLPTSNVKMGNNSTIKFLNGACINSNGAFFSGTSTSSLSNGIVLENSGIDSIVNCTFSNAKTAISIINYPSGSFTNRVIKNNTFNVPSGGDYKGIYGENNYNILIQDNVFNMPVTTQSGSPFYSGIFLKNSSTSGDPESAGPAEEDPETSTPYSLNIIHNTFNNGSGSIVLANYTSNVLPYYIRNNTFNSASVLGLLGMKITGTIRDNVSSNFVTPLGIHLVNSSPNLYNNTIISKDVSLHLIGNSYSNLAPYINGSQLIGTGGKNRFTTLRYDNVQLVHPANVYTDFGENRFNILDTTLTAYHIYGWLDSTISTYYARNNCWYPGNAAKIYLRHTLSGTPVPTVTGVTTIDCDREIDPNGWIVDSLGNDVYDSIMTSENNTGDVPSEADLIYEQAFNYMGNSLYLDAVSSFKNLIDTYTEYKDLSISTQSLYSCYEYLDTSLSQSERNTLFGNLKIYAEAKINSDSYENEEFEDICFDIITMCDAKMENYDAASNNYEFIALYHPDPDIRLNASWNYAEVQALINSGGGGGNKLQVTNYELRDEDQFQISSYELRNEDEFEVSSDELQLKELKELNELNKLNELNELNRLNELISSNPVMSKMKSSFEKSSIERKESIERRIRKESKSDEKIQMEIKKSNELDESKEVKARRNLFELKNISDENLERRRIEDMMLSMRSFQNEPDKNESVSIPVEYALSQNYPNPFNPTTNLEFVTSQLGFVSLKVFDVLGKEVMTLVNENKPAGRYSVIFDGSNLSSGIYFYKIEAGDFVQVKRMMLLK